MSPPLKRAGDTITIWSVVKRENSTKEMCHDSVIQNVFQTQIKHALIEKKRGNKYKVCFLGYLNPGLELDLLKVGSLTEIYN